MVIKADDKGWPILTFARARKIREDKLPFQWESHWFQYEKSVGETFIPCDECELDSLCDAKVKSICCWLDSVDEGGGLLRMIDGKTPKPKRNDDTVRVPATGEKNERVAEER